MLTIETTPELETSLQAEAEKLGVNTEQLLLRYIAERLPQEATTSLDDETAALDELVGCLADVASLTTPWRRYKEEEMALEEEKFLRRFRGRQSG